MRGSIITIIGATLLAAGAVGLYNAYSSEEPLSAAISWGGLILGAIITMLGLTKRGDTEPPAPAVEKPVDPLKEMEPSNGDQAQVEIRALVQSMGVVAVADKRIRDQEIAVISSIHEQMLGVSISELEVREILSEFGPEFDIKERLTRNRSKISPSMKRVIIQSCHLVMVSDLEIVHQEENRIQEIGSALGFSENEIEDIIASAGV